MAGSPSKANSKPDVTFTVIFIFIKTFFDSLLYLAHSIDWMTEAVGVKSSQGQLICTHASHIEFLRVRTQIQGMAHSISVHLWRIYQASVDHRITSTYPHVVDHDGLFVGLFAVCGHVSISVSRFHVKSFVFLAVICHHEARIFPFTSCCHEKIFPPSSVAYFPSLSVFVYAFVIPYPHNVVGFHEIDENE